MEGLQGWEAGELWQQLREHRDQYIPSWCPIDKKHDCAAYGYARQKLLDAGLLELDGTPSLAALSLEWK